jgi:hypothetical protein
MLSKSKEKIMSITWILALIAFIMSFCFYAWSVSHGIWGWQILMLLGFILKTLSEHPKAP